MEEKAYSKLIYVGTFCFKCVAHASCLYLLYEASIRGSYWSTLAFLALWCVAFGSFSFVFRGTSIALSIGAVVAMLHGVFRFSAMLVELFLGVWLAGRSVLASVVVLIAILLGYYIAPRDK